MATMAETTMGELNAYAAGGPDAATEYRNAQSSVSADRSQALQDAANRSGAAYAPEAYRTAQAQSIAAPLDSTITALGSTAGAAGQYGGALSSAQNNYMSSLNDSKGAISSQLQSQSNKDYVEALNKVNSYLEKQQASEESQKKANDKQNSDYVKSQKEFARQDAANAVGGDGSNLGTYNVVDDVVGKATDGPSAKAYFLTHYSVTNDSTGKSVVVYKDGDKAGEIVEGADPAKIDQYLTQAFQDQQQSAATLNPWDTVEQATPGQNYVQSTLVPGTPEYEQFMAQYK